LILRTPRKSFMTSQLVPIDGLTQEPQEVVTMPKFAEACECGNVFLDDAAFCRKCGTKRPELTIEEVPVAIDDIKLPAQKPVQAQKPVHKETRVIDDTEYSIEMFNVGGELKISAVDAGAQFRAVPMSVPLELQLKNQDYRKVFNEVKGDFGAIAARLRIQAGVLLLVDAIPLLVRASSETPTSGRASLRNADGLAGFKAPSPTGSKKPALAAAAARRDSGGDGTLNADAMVVRGGVHGSAGSARVVTSAGSIVDTQGVSAEIDFNGDDGPKVRLRGLTPMSRAGSKVLDAETVPQLTPMTTMDGFSISAEVDLNGPGGPQFVLHGLTPEPDSSPNTPQWSADLPGRKRSKGR